MKFECHEFGVLTDGTRVNAWTARHPNGCEVEVITYGATLRRWVVPDAAGRLADVVLGFSDLEAYVRAHPYVGATVGRVAGRISRGEFVLGGTTYRLALNDGPNHLHGGVGGFHRKVWTARPVLGTSDEAVLDLSCVSGDGEDGYPGNVRVNLRYRFTGNSLSIVSQGISDRSTPFGLTHHSYFNLEGEGEGDIGDHILQVHSDTYAEADERMALVGRRRGVVAGVNDFNLPRTLQDALPHLHHRHGDLYFVREGQAAPTPRVPPLLRNRAPAAMVRSARTGRKLTVYTSEPCLQLYCGACLDGSLRGKAGRAYGPHAGLCLECERYPDGVNTPELGSNVLAPGEVCRQATAYVISHD